MTKHVWRVKKEYFHQLKSGAKTLEVRVGYPQQKKVKAGDIITFENYGPNEFDVLRVTRYPSFKAMLECEGVEKVLPGRTFEGALRTLQSIYQPEKESFGVYVFELRFKSKNAKPTKSALQQTWNPEKPTREYFKASDLLKNGAYRVFSKFVQESYDITDWITKDYPDHCDHFYSKYIPGIFDGEREIISCYVDGKIVATAILKKDKIERKISTLFVKKEFQKQGIATELVEQCFKWLGTTKPLITIADYKLEQFQKLIEKYGWVETSVMEEGFYNDHSREHVFNG